MEVLWEGERFALGEVTEALKATKGWNKKTVYTYLTRMETKGMVHIKRDDSMHHEEKPYSAAVTKESCAREERQELLTKVYGGATGDLIAAFLKESDISQDEVTRLKKMLDEMEV